MVFAHFWLWILQFGCLASFGCLIAQEQSSCIEIVKQIRLEKYPEAFNPSILKIPNGYLLSFRYCPNQREQYYSHLGVVELDNRFQPISEPQILETLFPDHSAPEQAQDARLIEYQGAIYLLYNDNFEVFVAGSLNNRTDMFLSKLTKEEDGMYLLHPPVKLQYPAKRKIQTWEKNWVPFVWKDKLHLSYSIKPHEVLKFDFESGVCAPLAITQINYRWIRGHLRGGTTAQLVDDQYLAFFHSSAQTAEYAGYRTKHYYMGAYTFEKDPPFAITAISSTPLYHPDFYQTKHSQRIIYPCGYVARGPHLFLVYGKDDREMWVAIINKVSLLNSLKPLRN